MDARFKISHFSLMAKIDQKKKRYENVKFLGEGQFATVYKAKDSNTSLFVAVKKIKLASKQDIRDGINRTALREIKLLEELKHENVIGLLDAFGYGTAVSLVFDFMDTDLEVIIKDTSIIFTPANIKAYALMTLLGLEYLHNNWILHRDLKPNNLLINRQGVLKIADFGLARVHGSPNKIYTNQVVTRWYRSPELLFGAFKYGVGVDTWAVGCILAELLLRVPFLPGESDLDQLTKIFQVMGSPTEEEWTGVTSLPAYIQFKSFTGTPLASIFTAAGDDMLDLLSGFFSIVPIKRLTCKGALNTPYFKNRPAPSIPDMLPFPNIGEDGGNKGGGGGGGAKKRKLPAMDGDPPAKRLLIF